MTVGTASSSRENTSCPFRAPPRPPRAHGRPGRGWLTAAGLVAVAGVVAAAIWATTALTPTFIDTITVENPTDHPVTVQARAADDGTGWLSLSTVPPQQTVEVEQVHDLGATWALRFSHRDVAVEATYSRDELDARGWQVTVPDELPQRLREQNIPPPDPSIFD